MDPSLRGKRRRPAAESAEDSDDDVPVLTIFNREKRRKQLAVRSRAPPRWKDSSISDGDLTMWELCCRNVRELSAEEKEERRQKKLEQQNAEQRALEERQQMLMELGTSSNSNDVLALFGVGNEEAAASAPAAQPAATEADLFNAEGPASDLFDAAVPAGRDDIFELTTYEASNSASLTPFKGAYKRTKVVTWTTADTNELYKWISIFGNDCVMIQAHMPKYSHKQICTKINRERKSNASLYSVFANARKAIDVLHYESIKGSAVSRDAPLDFAAASPALISVDALFDTKNP